MCRPGPLKVPQCLNNRLNEDQVQRAVVGVALEKKDGQKASSPLGSGHGPLQATLLSELGLLLFLIDKQKASIQITTAMTDGPIIRLRVGWRGREKQSKAKRRAVQVQESCMLIHIA